MNIFQALREDHERQREMANILVDTHGDSQAREEAFNILKKELHDHAKAEERHFYLPLIESDLTQEKARHGMAEHHEFDELVEELEQMDYSSAGWLVKAKHLSERLHHHLAEEEHEFFQLAGKVFSEKEKVSFAKEFKKERDAL